MDDARPLHRVYVDGFWMDATEVTNEAFARFVAATGYVVFTPPDHAVSLTDALAWWSYVPGAD
jgi:formylglycine-generating enzyme required for sulfatase activity